MVGTVKMDSHAASNLLGTLIALRSAGINKNLLIEMNDSYPFGEIVAYIDLNLNQVDICKLV
jgi:hypothetical protein